MSHDVKCQNLAAAFLADEPNLDSPEARNNLAESIQRAIEHWLEARAEETAKDIADAAIDEAAT